MRGLSGQYTGWRTHTTVATRGPQTESQLQAGQKGEFGAILLQITAILQTLLIRLSPACSGPLNPWGKRFRL